ATERHYPRAQIVNGKEESPAEPGHDGAILPFSHETRFEQHVVTHPQPFHCIEERHPAGRIAQSERKGRVQLDVPRGEVLASHLPLGTLAQLARATIGGRGHGAVQGLAGIGAGRPALGDGDPDPARDFPHRGRVIHSQLLHEEGEDVTALVAYEAVEHPFLGDDGEVAVCAAVKGTRRAKIRARPLELDVLSDDPHDVRGLSNLLDHIVGNEAHAVNSATVTPEPPWFAGANPNRLTRASRASTSCTSWRSAPVPLPWITRRYGRSASTAPSSALASAGSASATRSPMRDTSVVAVVVGWSPPRAGRAGLGARRGPS